METIIQHLSTTFKFILDAVDLVYMAVFMISSYTFLKTVMVRVYAKTKHLKTPWILRTRGVVLCIALYYAIIFATIKIFWGLPWHDSSAKIPYGFVLLFSITFAQFLNLYGIELIVKGIIEGVKGLWQYGLNKFKRS